MQNDTGSRGHMTLDSIFEGGGGLREFVQPLR